MWREFFIALLGFWAGTIVTLMTHWVYDVVRQRKEGGE